MQENKSKYIQVQRIHFPLIPVRKALHKSWHGCVLGISKLMQYCNQVVIVYVMLSCTTCLQTLQLVGLTGNIAKSLRKVPHKTWWQASANSSMQKLNKQTPKQSEPRNFLVSCLDFSERHNAEKTVLQLHAGHTLS